MNKIFLFPFLFILLSFNTVLKAQAQRVQLTQQANDDKSRKLQAIVAVYHYKGQPFEDPVLNGIETKAEPHYFNVKMPDLKGVRDTDYAYFFFGGAVSHPQLPGYMMAIVANNTRNDKPCHIWLDRNLNLDFTDDGPPEVFLYTTQSLDIKMKHPAVAGAEYTVRISRFPFNYNTKYLVMLDDYYEANSGKKKFAGSFFSFREERLNLKAGDYKSGNDSFRIAVKDVNCNGLYDDDGTDVVLIGDYGKEVLPDNKITVMKGSRKFYFEKNGKHYDIKTIDPLGASIDIAIDENAKIKNALVVGKKIKKFKFKTAEKDAKSVSIKKFRKKPVYIYVWRFGQDGFDEDTAALREIQSKYSDKINLITLNYGEKPVQLLLLKRDFAINWRLGLSSAKINKLLFVENYPTGILTGRKLKVKQVGLSPSEILSLLRNNAL